MLEFEERPDYKKLRFMMKKIIIENNFVPDNKFDWNLNDEEEFK
jgi:hypothetical protein